MLGNQRGGEEPNENTSIIAASVQRHDYNMSRTKRNELISYRTNFSQTSAYLNFYEKLNYAVDLPPLRTRYTKRSLAVSYLLDWIVIILQFLLVGAFSLSPKPDPLFPLNDPSLSYPMIKEIIPPWLFFLLCVGVPLILFVVIYFLLLIKYCLGQRKRRTDMEEGGSETKASHRKRSDMFDPHNLNYIGFHDLHHATLGLLTSVMISLLFSSFMWVVVGGLRPNHYAECNIQTDKIIPGKILYNVREICASDAFNHFIQTPAFPSGHAANAFACWIFTFLYLNGKFKIWDDHSHQWKVFLFFVLPILMPIGIASSRYLDYHHNGSQVLFGSILGIVSGFIGYRLYYCSWFDNHTNHLATCFTWVSKSEFEARSSQLEEEKPWRETQSSLSPEKLPKVSDNNEAVDNDQTRIQPTSRSTYQITNP